MFAILNVINPLGKYGDICPFFLPYSPGVSCLKWLKKIQFYMIWSCWSIWGHSEFMDVWSVLHSSVLQIKQRTSPHLSGRRQFTHIKHTTPHHCHVRPTYRSAATDCSTHPLTHPIFHYQFHCYPSHPGHMLASTSSHLPDSSKKISNWSPHACLSLIHPEPAHQIHTGWTCS